MAPNKDQLVTEVERLAALAEVSVDTEDLTNDQLKEKISELTDIIEAATAPDDGTVDAKSDDGVATTAPDDAKTEPAATKTDSLDASSGYAMAEGCCIRSVRGRMMVGGDEVFVEDFGGVASNMEKHIDAGQVVAK